MYFSDQRLKSTPVRWQDFLGKCDYTEMDARVTLNDNADNNIDYLRLSPDKQYNTWILEKPDERFYKFGGYVFGL